jgi:high-affinity nickel-transport protein
MDMLSLEVQALAGAAVLLGFKHGLDADHLAAIDALARSNAARRPSVARWSGFLFSAGHGAVVAIVACAAGVLAGKWAVPGWAEDLGMWISIAVLTFLGVSNLYAVGSASRGSVVRPVGFRAGFLRRLGFEGGPAAIFAVGALFALSFDTLTQATLFAAAGSRSGDLGVGLALAAAFTGGMMIADAVNGLWIARLMRRADQVAASVSRVMGLAVGVLSLTVAAFGASRHLSPRLDAWTDGRDIYFGVAVIASLALAYGVAMRRAGAAPQA